MQVERDGETQVREINDEAGNTGRREMQCRSAGRAHRAKPQVTELCSKIRFITGVQQQSGRWEDRKHLQQNSQGGFKPSTFQRYKCVKQFES